MFWGRPVRRRPRRRLASHNGTSRPCRSTSAGRAFTSQVDCICSAVRVCAGARYRSNTQASAGMLPV